MSTKVEKASSHSEITTSATSSVAATGSKTSMFAKKSGFVIPKNKLSGSLVPIFRGGKKTGSDTANEESTKQVQRKTKWGPDMTQDTAVRKGRALAYQTRVDQINQHLTLGTLGANNYQDLSAAFQIQEQCSSDYKLRAEELQCLELERREAIGEILKLNPSHKVPADYKPLLKEAKVPIPIKEYPGYNFINLIFGPANDTQKRLEKETGAKIRVYGTKADSGEKVEVTTPDEHDMFVAYEEIHVHVSADTFEKVDAAVALIELLVTPVSVNPGSISTTSTADCGEKVNDVVLSQGAAAAVVSQGATHAVVGTATAAQQNNVQQFPRPWFPMGSTQIPTLPLSGFTSANPSAQPVNNPAQLSLSHFNPSNTLSAFGSQTVMTAALSSVPQNPSHFPSGPQPPQLLQRPYMSQLPPLGHTGVPRNLYITVAQSTPAQPNITTPPPLSANQPTQIGHPQIVRPGISSLPHSATATFTDQPLTSAGGCGGWLQSLQSNPASSGPRNMIPPAMTVVQGNSSLVLQQMSVSGAPPRNLTPLAHPSGPQSAGATVNGPVSTPPFASTSHTQMGLSPGLLPSPASASVPLLIQSSSNAVIQPYMLPGSMPTSSPNMVQGSIPVPSPVSSTSRRPPSQSGIPSSVNPIQPPFITAPRPQQPSSIDFTFQPNWPQNPTSQVPPRPNSQPLLRHSNQSVPPPQGSHAPPFYPAIHSLNPSPLIQGFPRPQVGNQMSQPRAQTPLVNLARTPTAHPGPSRHAVLPNPAPISPTALMQPRNLTSAGSLIPRSGVPMQSQQNYSVSTTQPQRFAAPNDQFNSNISFLSATRPASRSSVTHQIYDPFSPTSTAINPQLSGNRAKMDKQENDPEYEDLMASVGVK